MASLRIDNLPDDVLAALKREAKEHSRDVADEAAHILTLSVRVEPRLSAAEKLQLADAIRAKSQHGNTWLTPEFIRAAREDGRA